MQKRLYWYSFLRSCVFWLKVARWIIVTFRPTVSYQLTDLLAMYTRPEMKLGILV